MNKSISIISIVLILLSLPIISQAQGGGRPHNEYITINFPSTGQGKVREAKDYAVYLISTGTLRDITRQHGNNFDNTTDMLLLNWLNLRLATTRLTAGLIETDTGVHWFAAVPRNSNSPQIDCWRGTQQWFIGDRHTACISSAGDLGLSSSGQIGLRVQIFKAHTGWIVRFRNEGTNQVVDAAKIHSEEMRVTYSQIVLQRSWRFATTIYGSFYGLNFQYRNGYHWSKMPSNVYSYPDNYSQSTISSTSTNFCQKYGVAKEIGGVPFSWYMGNIFETSYSLNCSGNFYQGGGPATKATAIIAEYSGARPRDGLPIKS